MNWTHVLFIESKSTQGSNVLFKFEINDIWYKFKENLFFIAKVPKISKQVNKFTVKKLLTYSFVPREDDLLI